MTIISEHMKDWISYSQGDWYYMKGSGNTKLPYWLWFARYEVPVFTRLLTCHIFGHQLEYEDIGDAEYGPKMVCYCKRCNK